MFNCNYSVFYDTLNYDFMWESAKTTILEFILDIGYTFGLFFGIIFFLNESPIR